MFRILIVVFMTINGPDLHLFGPNQEKEACEKLRTKKTGKLYAVPAIGEVVFNNKGEILTPPPFLRWDRRKRMKCIRSEFWEAKEIR